jgi:Txe/YoeB family toxin of Txe-Axe toxin-antitoxin module
MTQTSQISVMSTLGEDVKVFLSQLNEKDSKGNTLYNNIGLPKKMSLNTVQGIILKGLQDVTHSDLLYPELEKLAKEYSMVHEIIKELKKSPTTEAQFYASLTKHFTNYTGTRITEENGVIKYNTYDINNSADANEFLKQ